MIFDYEDNNEPGTAMNAARARGLVYAEEFYRLPKEEKIARIAELIYFSVALDPFGFPNGRPSFNELPDIDHNHQIGDDKARYIQAASTVYSRLMWKPEEEQEDND